MFAHTWKDETIKFATLIITNGIRSDLERLHYQGRLGYLVNDIQFYPPTAFYYLRRLILLC